LIVFAGFTVSARDTETPATLSIPNKPIKEKTPVAFSFFTIFLLFVFVKPCPEFIQTENCSRIDAIQTQSLT
jgi:hypothetical protein